MEDLVLGLVLLLVILVMVTLGAVLLVTLFARSQPRGRRVLISAVAGPMLPLVPALPFALLDSDGGLTVVAGLAIMAGAAALAIGWPVAYFATRRLDRLTTFDASLFD